MLFLQNDAYAFSAYAIPTALTAILMVVCGAGVLGRGATRVNRAFAAMTAAAAVWMSAVTMVYLAREAEVALWWARAAYAGVPFLAPAVYHFAVEVLRIHDRRRLAVAAGWAGAAVWAVLVWSSDLIVGGVERFWWGYYPRYAMPLSVVFLLFFFGYLIAALSELVTAFRTAHGVERKRIGLLIAGLAIAYLGCVDFLPKYGVEVYPFGYLPILGLIVVVAHTIRIYDLAAITPQFAAREIISTMADPLFVCDQQNAVRLVNPAAENLLGHPAAEIIGQPLDRFLERGEGDEQLFRSSSGALIDVTLSSAPIFKDGEAVGTVIIGRDIRERRRAEREVSRAVTLLQSTLDSTLDGILVVGEGERVLSYNQRFLDMWRIPQEIIDGGKDGRAVELVLDQVAEPEEFRRVIESLYRQPEAESFDVIEFRDGRRFERHSSGRHIEGMPVRVWSFRDVSARFAAETALRESELRHRLLFEQNAAGVCVMDGAGIITDCNNTFAALLGSRRAELRGRLLRDLYARPVEHDELMAMVRDAGSVNSVEVELLKADSTTVWLLQNLVIVGERESTAVHSTVVDISDRKLAEEQIEFHAYHDVLTNLPNRKLFTDRLRQNLTHARRSGRPVAVMFIDVDHFKTINDNLGHTAGDELLLEVSYRLRHCVREEDTVARLGGDEFTIILSELRYPEDAANVAQKVLRAIQVPMSLGGTQVEVTASIGIALHPVDGSDPESLLRNADNAMYRAKESGRNNYQLCTDEMKLRAVDRLSLEARLRNAIANHQFVLYYQPQVNLLTGRIVGVEALVRWNDPERGLVEPDEFIPIAEESRLILPIGEWVLRTACRAMKEWQAQGVAPARVAVNLSARQFQQHDLVETVSTALQDTGLGSSALELEITESTAMHNAEASINIMRELRALGISIAIDDFGTGYSSLNYLKRFPINAVKIDRAFVSDILSNEGDVAIVSAVVGIARSLRLRVIAEGVETSEQYAFLRRKECDEGQGYYFSRPVTAEEVGRLLSGTPVLFRQPRLTM
ncbi:MAG TPA: EAL domain-containing protein [Thermoanaerobaculia bacterium]|nr:EAL domain-containing protein [Thermoanaerobaculia bacterium]